jgi:hypothetical protein
MQFLYPQFLWAFATLLIPIIIHLFYFRRFQTVYFSNVQFLSQLQEQKQTRSRLKHWLTLLTRLLLLTCLILAFAQPYFPSGTSANEPGKNAVSIYVDNSFSMRNIGEEGSLVQTAKQKAREVTGEYREADAYQLLTNQFKVANQQFVDRSELLPRIDEVQASSAFQSLNTVVSRQTSLLRDEDAANKVAFIIGDFQQSSARLQRLKLDSAITYYFIPLSGSKQGNVFIDSAWLSTPTIQAGQNQRLQFRLQNTGEKPVTDLTTKLMINGQQKGLATATLPAQGQDTSSVVFKVNETGWNTGKLTLKDYPVTFDDTYYLSYPVADKANILVVDQGERNRYLKAAYETDDYFQLTNRQQGNLQYNNLDRYDLIILDQLSSPSSGLVSELTSYTAAGGNVLLLPPGEASDQAAKPYQQFLSQVQANRYDGVRNKAQAISQVQLEHPLFRDVFSEVPDDVRYPKVERAYKQTSYTAAGGRSLMRLADGSAFFSLYSYEQGHIFASAIPMNGSWSNMPENALFIPLLYKVALYQDQPFQLAYTLGEESTITLNPQQQRKDQVYQFRKSDFSLIPPQQMQGGRLQVFVNDQLPEAGIYQLSPNKAETDNKQQPRPEFAFNYNRKESRLATYSPNTIQQALRDYPNAQVVKDSYANLDQTLSRVQRGTFFWKYFLWAALGFLLIETLLLKFLR